MALTTSGPIMDAIYEDLFQGVGEGGLEPPRPFGHRNLNPARLPIPPLARVEPAYYPKQHRATRRAATATLSRRPGRGKGGPWTGTFQDYHDISTMGLQQFERRLERVVEGVFAKAFRSGLQPVEIGRRLTREMDLRRTLAPKGTLVPNRFLVALSPEDHHRFASIQDELVTELVSVVKEHAREDGYVFVGPVTVSIEADLDLAPGRLLVAGDMSRGEGPSASLLLPEGRRVSLGSQPVTMGRLPECEIVVGDPNVSRRHAEIRPSDHDSGWEVVDLGSTNGTRLNGSLLVAPTVLHPGDQVTLGATTITFESA
jgi:hypothetical protein